MTTPRGGWRSVASFTLVALIWGSTWLVIKDQISAVPPSWTVTWRFLVAAIGMFALAAIRRERLALPPRALAFAALVGVFQFAGNFQFVYRAEHYLTSGLVAVLFALLLVPNALFGRLFLGTVVGKRFLAGSAVALSGIALLLLHEYRIAPPGSGVPLGIVLTICGILCASIANVLLATRRAREHPIVPTIAWAMAFGTLADALFAWITSGAPALDPRPAYLAGIAYLAIVGSVVTFPIYFALIRDWGPGKAAYNGVAVPVVAMALSTLFEGYRWTTLAVVGSMLAMAGLLIALSGRKRA
jgi:drug/metabolite transporter (DMT)-like permease